MHLARDPAAPILTVCSRNAVRSHSWSHAHWCSSHSSQEVQTAYMSSVMSKEEAVHALSGMLLGCYKDIFRWMDWTQRRWGSPDPGRQTLHVLRMFASLWGPYLHMFRRDHKPSTSKETRKVRDHCWLRGNRGETAGSKWSDQGVGSLGNWVEG